ncbi:hypothetical protein EYR36_003587 [Pleurotus pulmonarius]|nr:hypothetical protein EYR36_003581 [Pleurotus pulmonarius]KAF4563148.1 hypothetical protein EYR36_003587 [Pleurotus pulmonarius]
MNAPSQRLWIRRGDPNADTTFTLEENGWITSLQYYQKPLGTKPSLLYLRSEDEDGIPKAQDLGKLVPKKAEHLQLAVEVRAKRAYTIVNQGANPVVLHGYFDEATTLSTNDDRAADPAEVTSSSPNGPSIPDVVEATAGPARSNDQGGASDNKRVPIKSVAKTTVTRANPTRSARQPSILIADEEKEGGVKGRRPAANKKVAEDSRKKAATKQKTDDSGGGKEASTKQETDDSEGRKKAATKQETDDSEGGKKAATKRNAEDSERKAEAMVKRKAEDSGDETDGTAVAEPSLKAKKRRNAEETSAHSGSAANRKPRASKRAKTGATQRATSARRSEADARLVESLKEPKIEENQVGTGKEITMGSKVNVYYVLKIWNGATFMPFQSHTSSLLPILVTVGDSSDLFGQFSFPARRPPLLSVYRIISIPSRDAS